MNARALVASSPTRMPTPNNNKLVSSPTTSSPEPIELHNANYNNTTTTTNNSPCKTMKTFIRTGMKKYLEGSNSLEVKASEMWLFIKQCYPDLEHTKYRPSIIKSLWSAINQQFSDTFTLKYDIKQGPALQHFRSKQQSPNSLQPSVAPSSNISSPDLQQQQQHVLLDEPSPTTLEADSTVKSIQHKVLSQKRSFFESQIPITTHDLKRRKIENYRLPVSTSTQLLNPFSIRLPSATGVPSSGPTSALSECHLHPQLQINTAQVLDHLVLPTYHCMESLLPIEYESKNDNLEVNDHLLDEIFRFLQ